MEKNMTKSKTKTWTTGS